MMTDQESIIMDKRDQALSPSEEIIKSRQQSDGTRSIDKLVERLTGTVRALKLDFWMLSGEEASSGNPLRLLYAGHNAYPENKAYLRKIVFADQCSEVYLGKRWRWNRSVRKSALEHGGSLELVETPGWLYSRLERTDSFFIPSWLMGEIDLSAPTILPLDRYSFNFEKKKIARNHLSSRLSTDPEEFDLFYHTMYVPYTRKNHGEGAVIASYERLKKQQQNQKILFILQKGQAIAGCLIQFEGRRPHLLYMGVKDGDYAHIRAGAMGAIYYFGLLSLGSDGYSRAAVGWSRAFLNDGVLLYKKQRGACLAESYPIGFRLKVAQASAGARAFLKNNPFLYVEKGKYYGALFIDEGQQLSDHEFEEMKTKYYMEGMAALIIYPLAPGARRVPAPFADRIRIGCTNGWLQKKG